MRYYLLDLYWFYQCLLIWSQNYISCRFCWNCFQKAKLCSQCLDVASFLWCLVVNHCLFWSSAASLLLSFFFFQRKTKWVQGQPAIRKRRFRCQANSSSMLISPGWSAPAGSSSCLLPSGEKRRAHSLRDVSFLAWPEEEIFQSVSFGPVHVLLWAFSLLLPSLFLMSLWRIAADRFYTCRPLVSITTLPTRL